MEGLPLCLPPSSSTSSRTWWQGIWNNWLFPTIRQSKQKQHVFTFPGKGERLVQGVEITQTRSFLSIISFVIIWYSMSGVAALQGLSAGVLHEDGWKYSLKISAFPPGFTWFYSIWPLSWPGALPPLPWRGRVRPCWTHDQITCHC